MSLETITKAGKREQAVRALERDFSEDPSINVIPALSAAYGDNSYLAADFADRDFETQPPAFHRARINEARADTRGALTEAVADDYDAAADALEGKGYDPVRGIILLTPPGKTPEDYKAVQAAHKKAAGALGANEQALFAQAVGEIREPVIKNAAASLQYSDAVVQSVAARRQARLIGELDEALDSDAGTARAYMDALYTAANDSGKQQMAYAIGASVVNGKDIIGRIGQQRAAA